MHGLSSLKKVIVALFLVLGTAGWTAAQTPGISLIPAAPRKTSVTVRFSFDLDRDQFQGFGWTSPSLPQVGESMWLGNSFGVGMFVRSNRYFDIFMDMTYHRTQFLVGSGGEMLTGGYFDEHGAYSLWEDVYYQSKNLSIRLGGRFIYPIRRSIEPWVGLAYGVNIWNVGFSNQDKSDYYGDPVWGVNKASFYFLTGVDFVLFSGDKRALTVGVYLDYGRSHASPLTMERYFYDIAWTSDTAPGIPAWKFGISIGGGR
jgi:hypothetical protein